MWPFKKKKMPVDPRPTKFVFDKKQSLEIADLADDHTRAKVLGFGTALAHQRLWNRISEMFPDRRAGEWTLHTNATPMQITHQDHVE